MKYFFLSKSWTTGRVWEFGGLWNEVAWQRVPHLQQQSLCIEENHETLCLYEVEDAVLMVEVMPKDASEHYTIGQVVLKRLLSAEQVIERLYSEEHIFHERRCQTLQPQVTDRSNSSEALPHDFVAPSTHPTPTPPSKGALAQSTLTVSSAVNQEPSPLN